MFKPSLSYNTAETQNQSVQSDSQKNAGTPNQNIPKIQNALQWQRGHFYGAYFVDDRRVINMQLTN